MSAGSARRAQTAKRVFSQLLERGTVDVDDEASCMGCACTDSDGCVEGCWWLAVDRQAGRGVCSSCPDRLQAFRAQYRQGASE